MEKPHEQLELFKKTPLESLLTKKRDNLIHDFSLGALLCYHELEKKLEKGLAKIDDNGIMLVGKKKTTFMPAPDYQFFIENFPQGVYSLETVNLIPRLSKKKAEEIIYDLDLLRRDQYANTKKYYQAVTRPLKIVEKFKIEFRDIEDYKPYEDLCKEWVEYKLSQPTTFRMSFPTGRYRRCLYLDKIPTYKKGIWINGKLYGFIIFSLEGEVAFELAFVSLYFKTKIISGLNQYLFSYCLLELKKMGYKYVNSGYTLNKNLQIFKLTSSKGRKISRYSYKLVIL